MKCLIPRALFCLLSIRAKKIVFCLQRVHRVCLLLAIAESFENIPGGYIYPLIILHKIWCNYFSFLFLLLRTLNVRLPLYQILNCTVQYCSGEAQGCTADLQNIFILHNKNLYSLTSNFPFFLSLSSSQLPFCSLFLWIGLLYIPYMSGIKQY